MWRKCWFAIRKHHYVLPLAVLATLATQIGCPPPHWVICPQKVIHLDKPIVLDPDYVVAEAEKRKDRTSLYYAFQVEGNRELQIYPGEHPFALMIDKSTGKVARFGQQSDPGPTETQPEFSGRGWETLRWDTGRALIVNRGVLIEHQGPDGWYRRFDKDRGWSRAVPPSQMDLLWQMWVAPATQEDTK